MGVGGKRKDRREGDEQADKEEEKVEDEERVGEWQEI